MSQKIINSLFSYALKIGADNLTISFLQSKINFDYRSTAGLSWSLSIPAKAAPKFINAISRILAWPKDERPVKKYGSLTLGQKKINFYFTVRTSGKGEQIIIEIIQDPLKVWRLQQIGLNYQQLKEVKTALRSKSGLMVVSAPDRQGKSATLSALLLEINNPQKNIYWLNNHGTGPGYEIPGTSYCRFSQANWHSILKHDSDIIIVDDANNAANLSMAIHAAASGRLVIISLTASSASAAQKIITDTDQEKKLKAGKLKLLLWQTLTTWHHNSTAKLYGNKRSLIGRFSILKP